MNQGFRAQTQGLGPKPLIHMGLGKNPPVDKSVLNLNILAAVQRPAAPSGADLYGSLVPLGMQSSAGRARVAVLWELGLPTTLVGEP